MKCTKRLLAMLLCVVMICCLAPATAFAAPVNLDDLLGEWEGSETVQSGTTYVTTLRIYKEGGEYKAYYESTDDIRFGGKKISWISTWAARPDGTISSSAQAWVDAPVAGSNTTLSTSSEFTFDGTALVSGKGSQRYERKAAAAPAPAPAPASSVSVGDIIKLGGSDWRVLEVKDGKALVIIDIILFTRAFHSQNGEVTWETCDLRQYLN